MNPTKKVFNHRIGFNHGVKSKIINRVQLNQINHTYSLHIYSKRHFEKTVVLTNRWYILLGKLVCCV